MDGRLLGIGGLIISEHKELYLIFLFVHLGADDLAELILIFECEVPHLLDEVEVIEYLSF